MKTIFRFTHLPLWLFALLLITLLLRIPSLFEPYSYGDEMIYLTLGNAVDQGQVLYKDIHDNKPPMLYLFAALAGSLFWFKVLLIFWSIFTIILFWKLVRILFPKRESLHKVATAVFAIFTTIPLLEGNIVNAEVFMVGLTIAGFLVLLHKDLTVKKTVFGGVLFSFATLFKVPAAFDIPAIIFLWFVAGNLSKNHLKEVAKKTFYLLVGFLSPILLSFVWFGIAGALKEYIEAAFMQNVGYLSSWRPDDSSKPFLEKNGPLVLRASVVFVSFIILFLKRKVLSKSFVFVTSWLLLSLFATTLSERPYPHYLIQIIPAVALLSGILFARKNMEQVLSILPLTLAFLVPVYFKFWYYPTYSYYSRFVKLATGQISKNEYLATFGSSVISNYKIAEFLKSSTKSNDKIFVWGDDAKIYALSHRLPPEKYVTDYHINEFSNKESVVNGLRKQLPEMIVVTKNATLFPVLSRLLENDYALILADDKSEVWKLLSAKVRMMAP